MAAFRAGLEAGADGVECDVQLSRDGHPMVIHDEELRRLCEHPGKVSDLMAGDLEALCVLGTEEKVPRLEALCRQVAAWGCPFFAEIKNPRSVVPSLEIFRSHLADEHPVVVGSFHAAVVRVVLADGRWAAMQLINPTETDWSAARWERLAEAGIKAVGLPWQRVSQKMVAEVQSCGLAVWCWTVDEAAFQAELAEWGVDALITDYPDVARRVLSA